MLVLKLLVSLEQEVGDLDKLAQVFLLSCNFFHSKFILVFDTEVVVANGINLR